MGSYARETPGNCPACPCVKTALVLGYPPVGSSRLWVSLLNNCETSNSYCRAMTRFGIKPCEKIIFNSDLNFLSVLSNVDRKYDQCIPKKRGSRSASKRRYSRVIVLGRSYKREGGHDFFTLKILLGE